MNKFVYLLICFVLVYVKCSTFSTRSFEDDENITGCQTCQAVNPKKLTVHLVPHSHDDVGWLKTIDQYYFGSRNEIQTAGVQYIISSVVNALRNNPARKFIQVETAYFWLWWRQQTSDMKDKFKRLVKTGQIEMVNAAWSMNDEAVTIYQSIIDQFSWGVRFAEYSLGKCAIPRIGWQIDPFGHSREHASILAQARYKGLFLGRIDFRDKNQRRKNQSLEMIWRTSASLPKMDIFTSTFPDFYYPPPGYCFDIECNDEPMIDEIYSPDFNIDKKQREFKRIVLEYAKGYRTKNVLVPMGGDFHYQMAESNYINMDRLIQSFKNDSQVSVIYSTPSCYIKAVSDASHEANIAFPLKTDDFFPYASDPHTYWAGFYTSRPTVKGIERLANNILQTAKQLSSYALLHGNNYQDDLTELRIAMGILQHHDAITGTAKQAVTQDYSRIITRAIHRVEKPISATIQQLTRKSNVHPEITFSFCLLANISICEPTRGGRFTIAVYNPLAQGMDHFIRLPVPSSRKYKITGPQGEVPYAIVDSMSKFNYVKKFNGHPLPKVIVFPAIQIPPLGIQLFYVEKVSDEKPRIERKRNGKQTTFGTTGINFQIDPDTGLLTSIKMNEIAINVTQQFFYYESANGDNVHPEDRASGAYVFRPKINKAIPVNSGPVKVQSTVSDLFDEVQQTVNDWITQVIRVYKKPQQNYIEFDWLVGPIDV